MVARRGREPVVFVISNFLHYSLNGESVAETPRAKAGARSRASEQGLVWLRRVHNDHYGKFRCSAKHGKRVF